MNGGRRMIGRIGRIVWTSLIVAVAAVTTLAQLDRQSRYAPALAAYVPAPFQGFAARHVATRAVLERDAEAAMAATRRLVMVRPVPAEHLSMLAQAATLNNDEPLALAALGEASRRGWRDPLAQQAAAEAALLDGDAEAATQRIGALLATDTLPEETSVQLARLLAMPEGQAAFARYLANPGRWRVDALPQAARVAAPADVAETVVLARAEGAELSCEMLSRLAEPYVKGGFEAEAERFWPGDCPSD